jgi:deoxyribose-phosphate aldolase
MSQNPNQFQSQIAKYIDHTLLTPTSTGSEIRLLCDQAIQFGFAAVCVPPYRVGFAANYLRAGSPVGLCTVVGFPMGYNSTAVKVAETNEMVSLGATEIDLVVNIGAIKDGSWNFVLDEMKRVVQAAADSIVKIIIETGHLTREEIIHVSQLVIESGAHYVKTSTGYTDTGATVENIKLIRSVVGDQCKIKASSKIRDYPTAKALIEAGAHRLGVTASLKILEGEKAALQP